MFNKLAALEICAKTKKKKKKKIPDRTVNLPALLHTHPVTALPLTHTLDCLYLHVSLISKWMQLSFFKFGGVQSALIMLIERSIEDNLYKQSNLDNSNTGGSWLTAFTMANSNSFLSSHEILPIAQEHIYLGKFSHLNMDLYVSVNIRIASSRRF